MRYLFIDRIEFLECNKTIRAIKNVALSEDVFSDHFVSFPVMPGALLVESLAQAGTALLEVSTSYEKKALPVMIREAKFRSMVYPGDRLTIEAKVLSADRDFVTVDGTIHVAAKLAVTAGLTFALKNAGEFYPASTRYLVDGIYEFWLRNAELVGFESVRPHRHG